MSKLNKFEKNMKVENSELKRRIINKLGLVIVHEGVEENEWLSDISNFLEIDSNNENSKYKIRKACFEDVEYLRKLGVIKNSIRTNGDNISIIYKSEDI